jgi:hypothetical protein
MALSDRDDSQGKSAAARWLQNPLVVGLALIAMVSGALQVAGVVSMMLSKIMLAIGVWAFLTIEVWCSTWIKRTGLYVGVIVLSTSFLSGMSAVAIALTIADLKRQQAVNTPVSTPTPASAPTKAKETIAKEPKITDSGRTAQPYPWISYNWMGGEGGQVIFVNLWLVVQEFPGLSGRDFASLLSLDNVHVNITAYLYRKMNVDGKGSQGMTCTVADMRALQWNNDNGSTQPLARLKLRPDATVLEIRVSARNGSWNGTSVLLNRGKKVDGDQFMVGRFLEASGKTEIMSTRRISDGISPVRTTYNANAKPILLSDSLINQDPDAFTYAGERLNAACGAFIYKSN